MDTEESTSVQQDRKGSSNSFLTLDSTSSLLASTTETTMMLWWHMILDHNLHESGP